MPGAHPALGWRRDPATTAAGTAALPSANHGLGIFASIFVLLPESFRFLLKQAQTTEGITHHLLFVALSIATVVHDSRLDTLHDGVISGGSSHGQNARIGLGDGESIEFPPIFTPIPSWRYSKDRHHVSWEILEGKQSGRHVAQDKCNCRSGGKPGCARFRTET